MARASKDPAKRLRFDLWPKPDFFRRWYWLVGVIFVAAGVAAWYGLHMGSQQRQYLPGPVSQGHASFGDRCETCHEAYGGVPTKNCLGCHADRAHSKFEVKTPECASCHVEHRASGVFLAVSNASCVDCHGDLRTTRTEPVIAHTMRGWGSVTKPRSASTTSSTSRPPRSARTTSSGASAAMASARTAA